MDVVFPDADLVVRDYLREQLAARTDDLDAQDARVEAAELPSARPYGVLVLVTALGGTVTDVIGAHQVEIQVWHPNPRKASRLAQVCRALLERMVGVFDGVVCYGASADPPVFLPDPIDGSTPVATLTATVRLRGADLS